MTKNPPINEVGFSSNPRWLWGIVASFALLVAANAVMIYFATADDASIVVSEQPYEAGLRYDEALNETARTRATGWSHALTDCAGSELCITLSDPDGIGVDGASVSAVLVRPSDSTLDTTLPLESLGDGRYGTSALPARGLWELTIEAKLGEKQARWTRPLYLEPK